MMHQLMKISTGVTLFLAVFFTSIYPAMGKKDIPIKPYSASIVDGEYLHYSEFNKKGKNADVYFVTRKETNSSGGDTYRTYFDYIPVASKSKPNKDYKKWPAYMVMDPKTGSVMETAVKLNREDFDNWAAFGMNGIIYWHFQIYNDKGYFEYLIRSIKDNQTNDVIKKISIKKDFPYADMISSIFYSVRFQDYSNKGIFYSITVQMIEPKAHSWDFITNETIQTKAGPFYTQKLAVVAVDPIANKFLGAILKLISGGKEVTCNVEDSDRRLVISYTTLLFDFVLEEVGVVK